MTQRVLSLSKDGHEYVFQYTSGDEEYVVDEVIRLAEDRQERLDWTDAATLAFQVAQYAAVDCGEALTARNGARHGTADSDAHESDNDDAKDGPCTNTNCP